MPRLSWPWRAGEALDRFLNVILFNGDVGDTISDHAAHAASQKRLWGCWLCRWLSWTVERDHCARTLLGLPVSPSGGLRAGTQLLLLFLTLTGLGWYLVLH